MSELPGSEHHQRRPRALAEMRKRFIARGYPRVVVSLILALSGLTAFGFSAFALRFGVGDMGLRYLAAGIAGYLTFLFLIRVWISLHRSGWHVDLDVPELSGTTSPSGHSLSAFGGGRSGGAGAGANWGSTSPNLSAVDVDFDDGWPVVLGLLCLLGGLLAMIYVVYAAPALLAEVALDAALVTGIYRKLRKEDARHWLGSAFRHTWVPALIAAMSLYAAGTLFQRAAPEAKSIGDVVRALSHKRSE